jgi:hypothetical protein
MRRLMVLLVVWLGSSVIAGAAAAGHRDLSNSGLCRAVDSRLERCRSGDLSAETRASCDRIEAGSRALCGPRETILASADADGAALDLLRQDYLVAPIGDAVSHVFPTHLVIGPSDLRAARGAEDRTLRAATVGDQDTPPELQLLPARPE